MDGDVQSCWAQHLADWQRQKNLRESFMFIAASYMMKLQHIRQQGLHIRQAGGMVRCVFSTGASSFDVNIRHSCMSRRLHKPASRQHNLVSTVGLQHQKDRQQYWEPSHHCLSAVRTAGTDWWLSNSREVKSASAFQLYANNVVSTKEGSKSTL